MLATGPPKVCRGTTSVNGNIFLIENQQYAANALAELDPCFGCEVLSTVFVGDSRSGLRQLATPDLLFWRGEKN